MLQCTPVNNNLKKKRKEKQCGKKTETEKKISFRLKVKSRTQPVNHGLERNLRLGL
jgi:hypothetical protein